jgi:hypothetical protein
VHFLGRATYCLYRYFVDFVVFTCLAQASQLVEPVQAPSPQFTMPRADMVHPSSSDTKEALDLLFLSPIHGPHSPVLNLCLGSDSDAFEDWPKANDMAASVYVALTADASSSRVSTVDNLCDV